MAMTLVQLWRRWTISTNVCLYLNYILRSLTCLVTIILACGSVTKVTTHLEVEK